MDVATNTRLNAVSRDTIVKVVLLHVVVIHRKEIRIYFEVYSSPAKHLLRSNNL